MRFINRHVSQFFRMGERFLNRKLAGSGISSGKAPLLLELRDGGDRNPVALAVAIGIERVYIARLHPPVSRGVNQADVETVNAVFDQFCANAQEYFT